MTTSINQSIQFSASWTQENTHLKSTLTQKISRFAFYLFHKLAISCCLPATSLFKKDKIANLKKNFSEKHTYHYDHKDICVTTPDGARLQGTFLQKKGCDNNAPCAIFMQPNAALYTGRFHKKHFILLKF